MNPHIEIGDPTPWGPALTIEDLGHDCFIVTTPTDGGLHVSDYIIQRMPAPARQILLSQPGNWPDHWADENFNLPITMAMIFKHLDKPTVVSTFQHQEDYLHHSFWANLGLGVARCFPVTYEPIIPLLDKIARQATQINTRGHHPRTSNFR